MPDAYKVMKIIRIKMRPYVSTHSECDDGSGDFQDEYKAQYQSELQNKTVFINYFIKIFRNRKILLSRAVGVTEYHHNTEVPTRSHQR